MTRNVPGAIALIASAVILVGCGTTIPSGLPSGPGLGGTASPAPTDTAAAEASCTSNGGQLVDRVATWNTNADPTAWLQLGGRQRFCEFESGTGDEATRISVDLVALSSEQPTLAAVANAIYDATGVRLRRVPFRPDRVLAALKTAGV